MSSKSICQRCVARIVSSPRAQVQASSKLHRTFSSSPSRQPIQTRHSQPTHDRRKRQLSTLGSQKQQAAAAIAPDRASTSSPQTASAGPDSTRVLLQPNNLFHSFTNSPSPEIRRRAAFIKRNAYCPHPDHQQTREPASPHDSEARKSGALAPKHVRYECPDCGIPVSCSEEHFVDDYESHLEICDVLREINEDDHDLRSGRFFPEFEYPGPQMDEAQINMTNWDTLLYSREFNAINDERPLRQATRLLTFPITVGSILHELSPYSIKKGERLTVEGLKSLSGEWRKHDPILFIPRQRVR